MLKVKGTEVQQMLTELMLEAAGPYGLPFDPAYLEGKAQHSAAQDDDAAPLAAATRTAATGSRSVTA